MGTHVNVTPKVQMSSSSAENAVYTENSIAVKWMVFNQASASWGGGIHIYTWGDAQQCSNTKLVRLDLVMFKAGKALDLNSENYFCITPGH